MTFKNWGVVTWVTCAAIMLFRDSSWEDKEHEKCDYLMITVSRMVGMAKRSAVLRREAELRGWRWGASAAAATGFFVLMAPVVAL